MTLTIRELSSGAVHIRGVGPCNWAQPPYWPCSAETLIASAFPEASAEFLQAALDKLRQLTEEES